MFFRGILILVIALLLVLPMASNAATVPAAAPAPDDRARQWLTLMDGGNYTQSWRDAAAQFQKVRDAQAWAGSAAQMRAPLGAMVRRDLKSVDLGKANIAVVRYDAAFANRTGATETVTLIFENGAWVVSNYAVS